MSTGVVPDLPETDLSAGPLGDTRAMAVHRATGDAFWVAMTQTSDGRVSDDAGDWLRLRLVTELAERFHRSAGLVPYPTAADPRTIPLASAGCNLGFRAFGRIGYAAFADDQGGGRWADLAPRGTTIPYLRDVRWSAWVDHVIDGLGLARLDHEDGHRRCEHHRNPQALPRAWRVAVTWQAPGRLQPDRQVYADGAGYHLVIDGTRRCTVEPVAPGAAIADLAAAVDERISGVDRLATLLTRSELPAGPADLPVRLPAGVRCFADEHDVVLVAAVGVAPDPGEVRNVAEVAERTRRTLHLILPEGFDPAFYGAEVTWVHDGYRALRWTGERLGACRYPAERDAVAVRLRAIREDPYQRDPHTGFLRRAWAGVADREYPPDPPPMPSSMRGAPMESDLNRMIPYWTPLLHLLVFGLGWSRPALGLSRWLARGRPTDDPVLAVVDRWYGPHLPGFLASTTARRAEEGARAMFRVAGRSGPPWAGSLHPDAAWAHLWNGGQDPLHLAMNFFLSTEPGEPAVLQLSHDPSDPTRATLMLDAYDGWYSQLRTCDPANVVDVVVKPYGWLGTYRCSSTTGAWFSGAESWHLLGWD